MLGLSRVGCGRLLAGERKVRCLVSREIELSSSSFPPRPCCPAETVSKLISSLGPNQIFSFFISFSLN